MAAFERAKNEAVLRGATLVVVNTGEAGNYAKPSFAKAEDLEAIDKELTEAGLPHEVLQPTSGLAAAEEILRVVGERDGPPHHRPAPPLACGELFMGSTAQQVLLDAPCAVLAVKAGPGADDLTEPRHGSSPSAPPPH